MQIPVLIDSTPRLMEDIVENSRASLLAIGVDNLDIDNTKTRVSTPGQVYYIENETHAKLEWAELQTQPDPETAQELLFRRLDPQETKNNMMVRVPVSNGRKIWFRIPRTKQTVQRVFITFDD